MEYTVCGTVKRLRAIDDLTRTIVVLLEESGSGKEHSLRVYDNGRMCEVLARWNIPTPWPRDVYGARAYDDICAVLRTSTTVRLDVANNSVIVGAQPWQPPIPR